MISTHINGQFAGNYTSIDKVPSDREIVSIEYTYNFYKPFWNGSEWVESATIEEIEEINKPIVPNNVRSRQLRLALIYSGFNLDNISNTIGTLEEPTRSVALTEWEYATSFDRDNSLLVSLGQMLGLNDTDIDNLFITANTL